MHHTTNKILQGYWELYSLITHKQAKDLPSQDVWIRHIRISAIPSSKQQKDLSHMAAETTTDHVGMQIVLHSTSQILVVSLPGFSQGAFGWEIKLGCIRFAKIDAKHREYWSGAVSTIDFRHSS